MSGENYLPTLFLSCPREGAIFVISLGEGFFEEL